jgi:mono/diheme cytochrome c family protein
MNRHTLIAGAIATLAALTFQQTAHAEPKYDKSLERGRYLLIVGGCNDCHTPGFAESGGKLEPKQWLTGSDVGFQGPWGVTYPSNLRTLVASLNEKEWLQRARTPMRPPMPSPSLMIMTDEDLKSVYRYIRQLGTAGTAAPDYVPPGQPVTTAVINFVPVRPL